MGNRIHIEYIPNSEPILIELPASKSLSNRALIIQHFCKEPFAIRNLSEADDTVNLIENLSSGASEMNVGAAGTNMRFLISCLSISPGTWVLSGTERLHQRPIRELVSCLQKLGADIEYLGESGFPPLRIKGKELSGGEITISGEVSSQFISSLLMIAPVLKEGLILHISGLLVSKSYIEMTLGLMHFFGINYTWNGASICIHPQAYVAREYIVEPDWSAAIFWYGLTAITGREVFIRDLSAISLQGDKKMIEYGLLLGVNTIPANGGMRLTRTGSLAKNISLNLINEPDIFPVFAFTCAALKIPVIFTGLQTLNLKESYRIKNVANELSKWGVKSNSGNDFFEIVDVGSEPESVTFCSFDDHRMAMAEAVMSLVSKEVLLDNPGVVTKSYPGFWNELKCVGFAITESL